MFVAVFYFLRFIHTPQVERRVSQLRKKKSFTFSTVRGDAFLVAKAPAIDRFVLSKYEPECASHKPIGRCFVFVEGPIQLSKDYDHVPFSHEHSHWRIPGRPNCCPEPGLPIGLEDSIENMAICLSTHQRDELEGFHAPGSFLDTGLSWFAIWWGQPGPLGSRAREPSLKASSTLKGPGVGQKTFAPIIKTRERHGPFG